MLSGGSPLAEVNDVTKNAMMRLQDCLDAEKENMLLSNVQTQPIKPAGRTKEAIPFWKPYCILGWGWLQERAKLWKEKK